MLLKSVFKISITFRRSLYWVTENVCLKTEKAATKPKIKKNRKWQRSLQLKFKTSNHQPATFYLFHLKLSLSGLIFIFIFAGTFPIPTITFISLLFLLSFILLGCLNLDLIRDSLISVR
jgi:hypothetical protein